MLAARSPAERVIDRLTELDTPINIRSCRADPNAVRMMGRPYEALFAAPERHRHEPILDRFLFIAQGRFPNENIAIRNASIRHHHTNARRVTSGNTSWTEWDCRDLFIVYVVTSEPMSQPVTLIEDISLAGATQADLYRRAHNWLTDTFPGINFQIDDFDLGRIRSDLVFNITHGQTYRITSTFTIDVHDERAQISFASARLQRTAGGTLGHEEPIFLQSIANLVQTQLNNFSRALITSITS